MGKTRRKRLKKDLNNCPTPLNDQTIIHLQKWLAKNGWKNETKLMLKSFPDTGRGISSKLSINNNDILISIPHDLMVTYGTVKKRSHKLLTSIEEKLTIHEFLSLFLIYENDQKETSFWQSYIDSLPEALPQLPWQATADEMELFPPDLQVISKTMRDSFKKSFDRVKRSIKKRLNCVFDENIFKWAYTLVNTRAVYVDPNLEHDESSVALLLDEPSMALCPFLDMFNHHFLANTEATLKYDGAALVYQLKTLKRCRKYSQIFICYGPHDNLKLMTEYGFFIPGNVYDTVNFCLEEILKLLGISFHQQEYKFLKEHGFIEDLYIGLDGLSYNLKAVLCVAFCENGKNYRSIIFAEAYTEDFQKTLPSSCRVILHYKRRIFEKDWEKLRNCDCQSEIVKSTCSFLKYRLDFVGDLMRKFCEDDNVHSTLL